MREYPRIEIKDNLEAYKVDELRFIAKEIGIDKVNELNKLQLITEISKKQTAITVNSVLRNIDSMRPSGLASILIDFWFQAFKRNKRLTLISTSIFFIALATSIRFYELKEEKQLEKAKNENITLSNKIKNLEEVESSLKNLIEFIENQKQAIVKTEQSIKELKKKKDELEPIVATQKETVEAILRQQENRNRENIWAERIIGVGLGIAGSIISSIIYGIFKRITAINNS